MGIVCAVLSVGERWAGSVPVPDCSGKMGRVPSVLTAVGRSEGFGLFYLQLEYGQGFCSSDCS